MPSTFLLMSPLAEGCGNFSTIQRIRGHVESAGHVCVLRDPDTLSDHEELLALVRARGVRMVLVLHAYKAGRHLLGTGLPYILIFGGTDVNVYVKDAAKLKVITEVVFLARCIISFTQPLLDAAKTLWPSLNADKCFEIKQAVVTNPSDFSLVSYLRQHGHITLSSELHPQIFLFVGGIRPVKDPLYVVNRFAELHCRRNDVFFVLLGSMSDESYRVEFIEEVKRVAGVVYIPGLNQEDTHAAIKASFALVNSSRSEGMAVAILEAMDLGTVVLARDIPGNRSIVTDNVNGLLYSSPEEFIKKSEMLLDDAALRQRLVSRSTEYVSQHHDVMEERRRYMDVISLALSTE